MQKLLLLLSATILFTACITVDQPEPDPAPAADPCPTGTIQFINNSDNPYYLYIDGSQIKQQPGKTTYDHTIAKGTYQIKVKQVSGYLFSPTEQDFNVTVKGCDKKNIAFP